MKQYFTFKIEAGMIWAVAKFDTIEEARTYARKNGYNQITATINGKRFCDCKV